MFAWLSRRLEQANNSIPIRAEMICTRFMLLRVEVRFFSVNLVILKRDHGEFFPILITPGCLFEDEHIFCFDRCRRSENFLDLRLSHSGGDLIVIAQSQFRSA